MNHTESSSWQLLSFDKPRESSTSMSVFPWNHLQAFRTFTDSRDCYPETGRTTKTGTVRDEGDLAAWLARG